MNMIRMGRLTAKAMPVDLPCIALRHVMSDISVYKFYNVFDGECWGLHHNGMLKVPVIGDSRAVEGTLVCSAPVPS